MNELAEIKQFLSHYPKDETPHLSSGVLEHVEDRSFVDHTKFFIKGHAGFISQGGKRRAIERLGDA